MPKPRIIAVVGATATGKTAVGETVARALGGEVVCADSRQVFRELDIGTGKPSPAERAALRHHLFDALSIGEQANAGWYARAARDVCAAVHHRGGTPVLVGGSGLYLSAARNGLAALPPGDPAIRERLRAEAERSGIETLHARLRGADPETAARIEPRDRQRITRALEVLESSGKPLSWWHHQEHTPGLEGVWRVFECTASPVELRERIAARTHWMFESGLIEETRRILDTSLGPALLGLRAIGYDEAAALIEGRMGRGEAERRTCLRTAQLAKRQRTWFRHQIELIRLEETTPGGRAREILDHLARAG